MKQTLLITIFIIFHLFAKAQSKTYYKHNEVDGWIKCTESYWFTVDQKGDTTFCSQITEDTNQDNPNEKPKYVINGAGWIVKPDTVKKTESKTESKPVASYAVQTVVNVQTNIDTIKSIIQSFYDGEDSEIKYITKYRNNTKYKYRDRYKKSRIVKKPKPVKEKPLPTINILKYSNKLWLIVTAAGDVIGIDAISKKSALSKFKKISSSKVLAVNEFSQSDIVR